MYDASAVFEVVIQQNGFSLTGTIRRQFSLSANSLPVTLTYAQGYIYMCDIHSEGGLFKYSLEDDTLACLVKNSTDATGIIHGVTSLSDGVLVFTDSLQRKVKQINPADG